MKNTCLEQYNSKNIYASYISMGQYFIYIKDYLIFNMSKLKVNVDEVNVYKIVMAVMSLHQ
jgi:hypothetical protein